MNAREIGQALVSPDVQCNMGVSQASAIDRRETDSPLRFVSCWPP
jgi:hypothetical protein